MHEFISHFLHNWRNAEELIRWGGYIGLVLIVFAETGLLVGFFLPGDSLLVTAGVLATTGLLNIVYLNLLLIVTAILGDAVGYSIGRGAGPSLFKREKSLLFRPQYLKATQEFYDRHGGKTIILARFMPFARTFAPVVAGIAKMPYSRFLAFNAVGGAGWVLSMTILGFVLGHLVDAKRIEQVVYLIVIVSLLPLVIGAIRARSKRKPTDGTAAGPTAS